MSARPEENSLSFCFSLPGPSPTALRTGATARAIAGRAGALLLVAALLLVLPQGVPGHAASVPERMEVAARPFSFFRRGSAEQHFGDLEFVGGLVLSARHPDFGGFSAFRFITPGRDFIGISDTGFWFFGAMLRDRDGVPVGVEDFRMEPILGVDGAPLRQKRHADAEGLSVRDGIATVSFERAHRISEFVIGPQGMGPPLRDIDFLVPRHELRRNAGFETVAHAPREGPLAGARIALTEMSLDARGDIFAAILEGPHRGIFTVARSDDFAVTDGAFLPGGDLLLLERSYSFARGVRMRLRRIDGDAIRPGRVVDGPVLIEAGLAHRIDNMEALDLWRRGDGALIVSMLSDDNQSFFQSTIYLEFRLIGE